MRKLDQRAGGKVPEQERIFDGPLLIAAEEARSRAGGQHAQVAPRADAALTGPRPAPCGRYKQSLCGADLHWGAPLARA